MSVFTCSCLSSSVRLLASRRMTCFWTGGNRLRWLRVADRRFDSCYCRLRGGFALDFFQRSQMLRANDAGVCRSKSVSFIFCRFVFADSGLFELTMIGNSIDRRTCQMGIPRYFAESDRSQAFAS